MTRLTRVCRAVGVGIAVTTATLAMTQVANAAPAPPNLDSAPGIAVPAGNQPFLVATVIKGQGVQTYPCIAGKLSTTSVPTAELVGNNDKNVIVHHSKGPTWTATDGSSVVAARLGDPVTVNDSAIPWLLLKTTKATPGRDGDRLAGTTFIQRVNTTGGVNPTPGGDCTADLPVPYTADYYFYKATGNANSKPVT